MYPIHINLKIYTVHNLTVFKNLKRKMSASNEVVYDA